MASNRCAVCKILNETCAPMCIYAPHFPSNDASFKVIIQIFGAVNVCNILDNLEFPEQREIAANCLRYAAEARIRNPISGCHDMILQYKNILNNVEQDIESAVNELGTYVGHDQVPTFYDLPMPDDFLMTPVSLDSFIAKIKSLNEVQKNQLMQLPTAADNAPMIMNSIFGKMEDKNLKDGHRADGASTSAGK